MYPKLTHHMYKYDMNSYILHWCHLRLDLARDWSCKGLNIWIVVNSCTGNVNTGRTGHTASWGYLSITFKYLHIYERKDSCDILLGMLVAKGCNFRTDSVATRFQPCHANVASGKKTKTKLRKKVQKVVHEVKSTHFPEWCSNFVFQVASNFSFNQLSPALLKQNSIHQDIKHMPNVFQSL